MSQSDKQLIASGNVTFKQANNSIYFDGADHSGVKVKFEGKVSSGPIGQWPPVFATKIYYNESGDLKDMEYKFKGFYGREQLDLEMSLNNIKMIGAVTAGERDILEGHGKFTYNK